MYRLKCLHEGFSVQLNPQSYYKLIIWVHVYIAIEGTHTSQNYADGLTNNLHTHTNMFSLSFINEAVLLLSGFFLFFFTESVPSSHICLL